MRRFILTIIAWSCVIGLQAAFLRDIPVTVTQPDGTVLHCFASGDEYFNFLHDKDGYTIMQHPVTGYYVYADKRDGKLVATDFVAGKCNPASKSLQPHNLISAEEWTQRRKAWEVEDPRPKNRDGQPNHGTLNNISIFIRFSDDGEFTNTYSSIDNMFNDMSGSYSASMRSYFQAVSYGAIDIPTTFYPGHNGETIISYQDTYPRDYFRPYNAATNPNGYQEDERSEREFSLLERAVNYINANYPIPTDLDIDYDNDGYVDNVCFIIKGGTDGWSDLLWPHKWNLQDRTVRINGKRVWTFNFQLADATGYFNTSTMCHEMNHSLSAPDLYHYDDNWNHLDPVGRWDLMESNTTPPQHMGAYMKMRYGHWIDEIPEITQAGTYTLNPISSATPTNVAYKIASSDANQFYVLEYRTKTVETALPGSGLLIYRIDTRFHGNADYDPNEGIYDEVYLFRLDGTSSTNGNLSKAHFSSNVSRVEFSPSTNPQPFLSGGILDNNFRIYNITSAGNTISFTYGSVTQCEPPTNLVATLNGDNVTLTWDAATGAVSYNVYRDGVLIGNTEGTSFTDTNLSYGVYQYMVRSVDSEGLLSTLSEVATIAYQPIPSMLTATKEGNNALLTWVEPEWGAPSVPLSTMTYGDQNYSNSVGYNNETTKMYWGHRYLAEDIEDYDGMLLYSVSFYVKDDGNYKVFVYEDSETYTDDGETYERPKSQVATESMTVSSAGWNDIQLTTPHTIDGSKDLWVFMYDTDAHNYPACFCQYSGENGYYYSTNPTSWIAIWGNSAFMIKSHLTDGAYTYNLYDGEDPIATNIEGTSYSVVNIAHDDAHLFTLKTNTSSGETGASNMAGLTIGTASLETLALGTADKMTVTEDSQLTVEGELTDESADNLILEDGAQLVNDSPGVQATVSKAIDAYTQDSGWHLLASPMADDLTASNVTGLLTNNYDLYTFDQSEALEWRNYETQSFDISNTTGYLYANSGTPTLTFTGTLAATVDPTPLDFDGNASFQGFNLIGNPYPCYTYVSRSFYVLNEDGDNFTLGDNPIPPCAAILVQAQGTNESVIFSKTALSKEPNIALTLTESGTKSHAALDKARITFNESDRLAIFTLDGQHSRLYIPQDGQSYAVACANGQTMMPVNFKATQNGTYTLCIEKQGLDLDYLHLIDHLTGADVDLLAGASTGSATYSFEAKTTDYASRFSLLLAPIYEDADGDNATFAYVSNGEIVIMANAHDASLQIVDMTGRVIVCRNGLHTISTNGMTPGIYVLHLIEGDNLKTQKIVIE